MSHTIELSDEELFQLQALLEDGVRRTHDELRRTENYNYREILRHNLDIMEQLTKLIETAERTAQAV
jgi:hypothetical protein